MIVLILFAATGMSSAAAADAARGETLFDPCGACHEVGPQASNGVGPPLNSIVGEPAGTIAGFTYSRAMLEASAEGLIWTPDNIDAYIADPRAFLPGTRMAFGGISSADERQDIIAYLEEISARETD